MVYSLWFYSAALHTVLLRFGFGLWLGVLLCCAPFRLPAAWGWLMIRGKMKGFLLTYWVGFWFCGVVCSLVFIGILIFSLFLRELLFHLLVNN